MSKFLYFVLIFSFVTLCLLNSACGDPSDGEMHRIQDRKDRWSLVLFFNKEVTGNQPYDFSMNVLGYPRTDGRGSDLLDGVAGLMSLTNSGYRGYAVAFTRDATLEQRAEVKSRIAASPLVFAVFEDAVPDDIRLPGDREIKREGFPPVWFAPDQ